MRGLPGVLALLVAPLLACGGAAREAPRTPDPPPPERRVSRPALGTLVEVVLREADAERARRAADAAFAEIERLEALLSTWRETSEISELSRRAGEGWVAVSRETAEALRRARAVAEASEGAFDPTVLPLVRLWGFAGGEPRLPSETEIARARRRVGWRGLEIDPERPRVRLLEPDMAVGLGGLGKGFVADRALETLRGEGIGAALVAAAGDLAFYGGRPERPWPVGVEDPERPGSSVAELALREGAASTSAPTYRFFEAEGRRFHHLLDPRTGRPARGGLRSVTVVAEEAWATDAWATALFAMGFAEARRALEARPELRGVLLAEGGARYASPELGVRWRGGRASQHSQRQVATRKKRTAW